MSWLQIQTVQCLGKYNLLALARVSVVESSVQSAPSSVTAHQHQRLQLGDRAFKGLWLQATRSKALTDKDLSQRLALKIRNPLPQNPKAKFCPARCHRTTGNPPIWKAPDRDRSPSLLLEQFIDYQSSS